MSGASNDQSRRLAARERQFATHGRVVNGTSWRNTAGIMAVLGIVVVGIGIFTSRNDEDFGIAMVMGFVLAALFLIGICLIVVRLTRHPIEVDATGLTHRGMQIPWDHIHGFGKFTSLRSPDALVITLTDVGWEHFQRSSGKTRRAWNSVSNDLIRKQSLYWSYGMDDDLDDFVAWLTSKLPDGRHHNGHQLVERR